MRIIPQFTDNAVDILKKRYLMKDEEGNLLENPVDMLCRVANFVASAEESTTLFERWRKKFYNMMAGFYFLPNSPTLMNAGRPWGQLSACYVVDVPDSMEGIFDALKKQALIHKSGGGTGFNFSKLRHSGATVRSTNGEASGPVSFMRLFDVATDVVQQGGMRRGANMGMLHVNHPDVLEFIESKESGKTFKNFNISVAATDEFMEKAINDTDAYYNFLLDRIVTYAWGRGDPGLVFIDRINQYNTTPHLGELEAVNPCAETPLYSDEACNLGSINLAKMVEDGKINMGLLKETVRTAIRFLDNVIEVNTYPLPEIKEAVKKTRKIGLGVMGWAEMLFQLRYSYESQEAINLAMTIMDFIQRIAHEASIELAKERGAYPAYKQNNLQPQPMRNATCTCIAPTGTIAILADCSSGIEPLFALEHTRLVYSNEGEGSEKKMVFKNKYYEDFMKNSSPEEIEQYKDKVFITAHDVSTEAHIMMQAAFQTGVDLAVSKTINMPRTATKEDVRRAYILAWETNCKGITIYRDGCLDNQILSTVSVEVCPVCGAELVKTEGCTHCSVCDYSQCSI